jgi:hypothetical protein
MDIHCRETMLSIYSLLAESSSLMNKTNKNTNISNYNFGTPIKNNQKILYKINKGGLITIYLSTMNKKTK